MAEYAPITIPDDPKLAQNIMHFGRALRRAGLAIGPGRILNAIEAVQAIGFANKADFFWTLHACFVDRPEHRTVFAQIFRLYWRDPRFLEHMMSLMLPAVRGVQEERKAYAAEKRAAEALLDGNSPDVPQQENEADQTRIDVDASFTTSAQEKLKTLDFEQMSTAEIAMAQRMLAQLRLPVQPLQSRRSHASHVKKQIDPRRTMQTVLRRGGDFGALAYRRPRLKWPNLVVLCDISGSMSQYSRMVLHFLHAVANHQGQGWAKLHAFTFGTRLTNITHHLAQRDVDAALARAGAQAQDWQGGTRIAGALHRFNHDWSRRVMGQGAVVLLITDGLDRDPQYDLALEVQRLQLSARRLIWLNPLLRWDGFAPQAAGIRAMLPYVDSFRAAHSISSLEDLARVISVSHDTGEKSRLMAMLAN